MHLQRHVNHALCILCSSHFCHCCFRSHTCACARAFALVTHEDANKQVGEPRIQITSDEKNHTLTIEDNGIGISPEIVQSIFDLFTQATRSLDRAQGGLGIGLTLVRHLVGMHGGSVSVRSGWACSGSQKPTLPSRLPVTN